MKNKTHLKRELGLAGATSIVVGNMIGSGIFTSPQSLAQVANPMVTVLAWVITGLGSILLALSFANLGTKYPATGGLLFIPIKLSESLWHFLYHGHSG